MGLLERRSSQEDVGRAVRIVVDRVGRFRPEDDIPAVRGPSGNSGGCIELGAETLYRLPAGLLQGPLPLENVVRPVRVPIYQGGGGGLPDDLRAITAHTRKIATGATGRTRGMD